MKTLSSACRPGICLCDSRSLTEAAKHAEMDQGGGGLSQEHAPSLFRKLLALLGGVGLISEVVDRVLNFAADLFVVGAFQKILDRHLPDGSHAVDIER